MRNYRLLAGLCLAGFALSPARAQTAKRSSLVALDQFSESIQALAARIAPSVVQISVTRYANREESTGGRIGVVLGKLQGVGSGVIVDPAGYIVTNASCRGGCSAHQGDYVCPASPSGRQYGRIDYE